MNLVEKFTTTNTSSSKNRKIEYIVIHYTAGITSSGNAAKNTANWFNKETTKASADFIVDDSCVVQYNGDIKNRYTWHCGGSKYSTKGGSLYKICTNKNSIGIEVCSNSKISKVVNANDENWYFTDVELENLSELVLNLMNEYSIDIDHVIRHYDVNGKPCPGIVGWNADTGDETEWINFKNNIIKKTMKESISVKKYIELQTMYDSVFAENEILKNKLKEIISIANS